MRHHSTKKKFSREKNVRNALMRSLARNLIRDEQITTTLPKAKALRPYIEKLVTKARLGSVSARRGIVSQIGGTVEVKKLVDTLAPKYKSRTGGYTRIIKLPARKLDAAAMAVIEFV
ncbi:MAG: 50S ribosomal protein L17 [Patescibacteria group bacterium]|nr:50S ribosomal protein L17 [Patescibacteria group bacterium]